MSKTYLVTGGCGFIGSYVIEELLKDKDADIKVICVDKMGVGADINHIPSSDARLKHLVRDISSSSFTEFLGKVDYILHLAAESHVDRSITNPLAFVDSNVRGTANVLELCKQNKARMVHVSTDEVYGHLQLDEEPFTEEHPLKPRSPYSASKASSDLLVQSYITTYGLNASITRCCNNYGPRQHNEKLIPTVIRSLAQGQYIPVYGKGDNIREWIHARDHAKAIIEVLHKEDAAELYNVPGSADFSNLDLIDQIIRAVVDKAPRYQRQEYIKFVEDRAGHDFKYAISTKHNLDAVANQQQFDLTETVDYYLDKYLSNAVPF